MDNFAIYSVFNNDELGLFGNTAAVIVDQELPPEAVMQRIAADLNQPATTFQKRRLSNCLKWQDFSPY